VYSNSILTRRFCQATMSLIQESELEDEY